MFICPIPGDLPFLVLSDGGFSLYRFLSGEVPETNVPLSLSLWPCDMGKSREAGSGSYKLLGRIISISHWMY
jgi:hypothetical protein